MRVAITQRRSTVIEAEARAQDEGDFAARLYATTRAPERSTVLTPIPYYIWCNRDPNPMQVWLRE